MKIEVGVKMDNAKIVIAYNSFFSISVLRSSLSSRGFVIMENMEFKRGTNEWM